MVYKLTPGETILPDDYPVVLGFVYIVDNVFTRNETPCETVGEWKTLTKAKEIRRCDLFQHNNARLGDKVTLSGEEEKEDV